MVVDTGQGIPCFDSCLLTVTWMSNIKDERVCGNGASLLFFKLLGLAYGRTHLCGQSLDNVTNFF